MQRSISVRRTGDCWSTDTGRVERRISSASWRRPKMNTWDYPIVEEVDHEDVS
jgi:hypothetical protein